MTGVKTLLPRSTFIGFDHLMNELDRAARHSADHYPPHNILKTDDHNYLIELAVAGFNKDELAIEVEDRILTVTGEHVSKGREYIHRGISTKKFKRTFRLSEYVIVNGADFQDGILSVQLKIEIPEELKPRKIEINQKNEDKKHDEQLLQEDRKDV